MCGLIDGNAVMAVECSGVPIEMVAAKSSVMALIMTTMLILRIMAAVMAAMLLYLDVTNVDT